MPRALLFRGQGTQGNPKKSGGGYSNQLYSKGHELTWADQVATELGGMGKCMGSTVVERDRQGEGKRRRTRNSSK